MKIGSPTALDLTILVISNNFFLMQTVSIKRSPPNTPSKAAIPLHKKMHGSLLKSPLKSPHIKSLEKKTKGKGKIFSPKKFKRKLGQFIHTVFPSMMKNKNVATETEKEKGL